MGNVMNIKLGKEETYLLLVIAMGTKILFILYLPYFLSPFYVLQHFLTYQSSVETTKQRFLCSNQCV